MKRVVNFKVEGENWVKAQDKAFNKLNKNAKIDGFRPGKAPRNIFERKYGKEEILLEAADALIHEQYHEIIEKGDILPVIEPKVELVENSKEKLEVNFTFITKPEVKLGEYKNLKVKKDAVKVTKEEVEHEIEHLLEHYAEVIEKDGKIENGDTAIIDFEGFLDGVAFEGGKGENYSLEIGSNTFIPGFEEGLIGLSKNDEKDLELEFPKDYHSEDLKGKKVVFKVKVNDVKTRSIPELDEEFFEDLNMEDVKSKEELENKIKEGLKAQKEQESENKYIDELLKKASDSMTAEIDEEIYEDEANRMYDNFFENLSRQGLNEEIYFAYSGTTKEDLLKKMRTDAESRVKYHYLLEEIINVEKINVTLKEVEKEVKDLAKKYNISEEEFLQEIGGKEAMKYELTIRKAINVMKEESK